MLVEATQTGIYGNKRIKEGERFELKDMKVEQKDPKTGISQGFKTIKAEDQFSERWMTKITKEEEKKSPGKKIVKPDLNENEEVI